MADSTYVRFLSELTNDDVPLVGGKNASLGEMFSELSEQGVNIPDGFATTSDAYREYLEANDLPERIRGLVDGLHSGERELADVGHRVRELIRHGQFPEAIATAITDAYDELSRRYDAERTDVAVRSSATAEDLPEASFAGQQETFLNVTGHQNLLEACRDCYASLFTDRAISYREEQGFDHMDVALSVGVQKMVRADEAGSGVMFTIDTETGFPDVVVIDAAWGLGENVVQGTVNPDEYRVFKPLLDEGDFQPIVEKHLGAKEQKMVYARGGSETTRNMGTTAAERSSFVLSDEEIVQLARWAKVIEAHYDRPMDIEWAKDGASGELFIVQARPETVQSQKAAETLKAYTLKERGRVLVEGLAIGEAIATGEAQVLESPEQISRFTEGSILVTGMTDPDWVPIMKKAAGIVTDHGGRTSHAAIVSREFGIPAIVGTGDATRVLRDGQQITLSTAEGEGGKIYEGALEFEVEDLDLSDVPETRTQIMINIASPTGAARWWKLPVKGIGLARMEFIINNIIQIHPRALVEFEDLEDLDLKARIEKLTRGYEDRTEYFVDHLARGIAMIAASQYPEQVIVRMSDFKTNEYADLIGGHLYEPKEDNPMLGWRGASRYYSEEYRPAFGLECRAIKRCREKLGFCNVVAMVPFCRTIAEAEKVLDVMADFGLVRGVQGLEIYVMAEIPSNIILAEEFAAHFDGFSIGSNDLTQLTLGVDRDSDRLAPLFDERDEAVKRSVAMLIERAHRTGRKVGICGQAPSDYPEFAAFLVEKGIDSISLNPDSVLETIKVVKRVEDAR
ncbi:MAG: phosphoenolpyruvate synthase [Armatimonadota bacterium]|jgi:pyruvate,water dikinase